MKNLIKDFYVAFFAGEDIASVLLLSATIGVSIGLLVGLPIAIIVYLLRLACS